MSDLDPAIRAVVIAEMSACVVDRDSLNWCRTHESRVRPRYSTCDAFDDATGLATSVREVIEPLIRADERERMMLDGWVDPDAHGAVLAVSVQQERERIAAAIEALPLPHHSPTWSDGWLSGRNDAARIARNRDSDE